MDILTKESFINLIVNSDNIELNTESIKEKFLYYIINSIENELKQINYDKNLSNYENENKYESDFINRIAFYYFRDKKDIALYKSTLENIKLLFSYDDLIRFIENKREFNTRDGWYIKYDLINKKPLDITTSGVISWIFFEKDFQMWLLDNPQYVAGFKTYDIIINLDNYIQEAIQKLQEYITKESVIINNENKTIHLKKYNYERVYCGYNCTIDQYATLDENNLYINQYNITSAENKKIPLFCNRIKFNLEAAKTSEFIIKNFDLYIYSNDTTIDITIKKSNIRITFYESNVIRLCYKSRHTAFYAIKENDNILLYEYGTDYRTCYIRRFYLSKFVAGNKTYEIIKKAITELAEV